ncbi:MAG: Na(+)-translocating NADH-quinone reductase subunit C [Myxococcaceae bacterium]|jgi:Na+-transporting NADH:ubiquinone oxidoreductase subunit C|nr:Na(+)-translocating NADH-quinone reductase subunit C [Myxococcaceae bacterium]
MRVPPRDSTAYIVGFAAVVCLVCAIPIASAAVLLRPKQQQNQRIDRLSKVLGVAELMRAGERLSATDVESRFERSVVARAVELKTGAFTDAVDARTFDQRKAAGDLSTSHPVPPNEARVFRVPNHAVVYEVMKDGKVDALVLPIQGYGLWSTMYGFLALEADATTISGITFYEHGETPGLGGEIENPAWQAKWKGRKAFGDGGEVKVKVIKGAAGPPDDDPFRVDGLSGATITSRGVSHTLDFWLGPDGFGPFLDQYRAARREGGR